MEAQRKAPQPPGATEFPVTLSENPRRDGLELRFPRKPSDEILDTLKAAGWRWSRWNSCWYHRNIPENRTFAERFLKADGVPVAVAPIAPPPQPAPEPPQPVAPPVETIIVHPNLHVALGIAPAPVTDVHGEPVNLLRVLASV